MPFRSRSAGSLALALLAGLAAHSTTARAGVPFLLDDADTPDKGHWEINIASQLQQNSGGLTTTAPHVEVNYGLTDTLQLTLLTPMTYVHPTGNPAQYGLGDAVVTVKWRVLDADDWGWKPNIAIAPEVTAPTGDVARSLGTGRTELFLPVWLSKDFNKWTVFGGGGFNLDPGLDRRNWWLGGVGVTYEIDPRWTVGAELYYGSSQARGQQDSTGYNLGVIYNINDVHHLMASVGRNLTHATQNNTLSAYLGYQLTF